MNSKILVLSNIPTSLVNFRGKLIEALTSAGNSVVVAAPGIRDDSFVRGWLQGRNIEFHDVTMSRAGLNPFKDLIYFSKLLILFRKVRPKVSFGYTIKPVIWGTIAAWVSGVPKRVVLICGLGYAFTRGPSRKRAIVQAVVSFLYRQALRRASVVVFQNKDDLQDFLQLGILSDRTPAYVVNGSGVDLDAYNTSSLPQSRPIRFVLVARVVADKGIHEFVRAAELLRSRFRECEFHLVGGLDENPTGISMNEVERWVNQGWIIWHGQVSDVRPIIDECHVFVLPSFYREGVPRSILEAMAMGRAIITTDSPGCRETVVEGENGFLIPVKSVDALMQAMESFIRDPILVRRMGSRSREIAEERFDVHKVNAAMLQAMDI